jgi:two-component system, NarL family, sensor histidine kinase BarA
VVEDEPHVRELLKLQVETLGVAALTAANIDEALALWRAAKPQLLLIDYHLEHRFGTELIAAIERASAPTDRPPMVIVSATLARPEFAGGAVAWLAKPLAQATLAGLLGVAERPSDAPAPALGLLVGMRERMPARLQRINAAWAARDLAALRAELHGWRSVARLCGMADLHDELCALQALDFNHADVEVERRLAALSARFLAKPTPVR